MWSDHGSVGSPNGLSHAESELDPVSSSDTITVGIAHVSAIGITIVVAIGVALSSPHSYSDGKSNLIAHRVSIIVAIGIADITSVVGSVGRSEQCTEQQPDSVAIIGTIAIAESGSI